MHELVSYAKALRFLLWLTFGGSLVCLLTGISEKAKKDASQFPPTMARLAASSSELMTASLALIYVVDKVLATRDKRIKRALEECCDRLRDDIFGDNRCLNDETRYHNRATIFKVVRWNWKPFLPPTRGLWLVPVARSHAEATSSSSVFWCPVDRPDFTQISTSNGHKKRRFSFGNIGFGENRCLGIAGCAIKTEVMIQQGLPDLLSVEWREGHRLEYAKKTCADPALVLRRKYVARSYCASRIGKDERKPIGVIVLDSYEEQIPKNAVRVANRYKPILSALLDEPFAL